MATLTPLQIAAAVAGIIGAAAGVFSLFKWSDARSVQSGTDNVQGDVTASTGSVAVGHGSTLNFVPPISNPEAQRRNALINELLHDYIRTHDGIPGEMAKLRLQAESYINCRLAEAGEQWRFEGKTGRPVPAP
jgi:hypothetical protein